MLSEQQSPLVIGIDASRALRPRPAGPERYAREIIRHLLQLPGAGRHVWRLYTDQPVSQSPFPQRTPGAEEANVELCVLPWRRMWTHRCLAAEVRRRPPSVFFVPSHVVPFRLPSQLPPCVVTIHDLGYQALPAAHPWSQRLYLTWGTRWSATVARRVIAISRATADDLRRYCGTPAGKIRVIYEAAAAMPVPSQEEIAAARREYGLRRPYALYVGTIQPRKNLARLIEAYGILAEAGLPEGDLVLAGSLGWLSDPIMAMAQTSAVAKHVRLIGYVEEDRLAALLAGAKFFCYPSLFEGFGLPVLEAQHMGVPVMTSNTSSLPEIAGDAALLVDPTDVDAIAEAMLRLSQDEALRARLIAAGYENVKRFSWEKAATETLAVLEEAAASAPQGGER